MAIRKYAPLGLADSIIDGLGSQRTAALLGRLDAATLWDTLAGPIRRLPEYRTRGAGRSAWEPVLTLKCLMLQKWFNLSDPGLEDALRDRAWSAGVR